MIFGHSFDFKSELDLQKEYPSFSSDSLSFTENRTIEIVKSSKPSLLDEFSFKAEWIDISGQKGRYHAQVPFEGKEEAFTWALEIKDVLTLVWDANEREIIYTKGRNYTPERLRFWVFHTFFPIVLELERTYHILHVGSVEIDGKPVLFSAPSFGGKSTITDYFIQKGHTMLSDDSLGIDKRGDVYYAISSYPFHRPYRELETLGVPVENFATESKPLHAVYLLEKAAQDTAVEIVELKGIEKFKAFHYSSFIDFSFMKQERFEFFTEMAKHVSVYKVKVPWDLQRLGEVYEAIVVNTIED